MTTLDDRMTEYFEEMDKWAGPAAGVAEMEAILLGVSTRLVTITGSPTGGDFTLTFGGETTGAIAYNASAATVDTALEALSSIPAGEVAVTGSAGGPWTITFSGSLEQSRGALTGDGSGLTGGSSPGVQLEVVSDGAANAAGLYQTIIAQLAAKFPTDAPYQQVMTLRALTHLLTLGEEFAANMATS